MVLRFLRQPAPRLGIDLAIIFAALVALRSVHLFILVMGEAFR